jgi:ABC-type polysaccharide/polyol phosphate export permease
VLERLRGLWRRRDLVAALASRDLHMRYRGSILGVAWSLLHPLLLAAVYTIAVRYVLRVPIPNYALFVLCGLLPWMFFANSLATASGAIVDHAHLIKKVAFPREALPLAAVLAQFFHFSVGYLLIVPAFAAWQVGVGPTLAALPVVMALFLIFTLGLALAAATAQVYMRDARHLIEAGLQIGFWLTPIVYSMQMTPAEVRTALMFNPLRPFVEAFRRIVVDAALPDLSSSIELALFAGASFALGYAVFLRGQRRFAELV